MKESNKPFTYFAAIVLFSIATLSAPAALAQSTEKPYTYVEQMPHFESGDADMIKFMGTNINYPKQARAAGVEGLVVVSFIVGTDGSISDVQTLKKLGKGTDEEAVRVVKLMNGRWKPGKQGGKPVPVRYTLPVRFALSEADRAAVADVANRVPRFEGGQEAMAQTLNSYLQLPEEAKQEDLNARITVKFTVEVDGTVTNMKVEKMKLKKVVGPGAEFDYMDATSFNVQNKTTLARLAEAAITAVRATSGRWEPAMQNGKPVAAELVLPLQFLSTEADKTGNQQMEVPTLQKLKPKKDVYNYKEVDVKPELKDMSLEKFLAKNLRYPANSSFEGDVQLTLLVTGDGRMVSMLRRATTPDEEVTFEQIRDVIGSTQGRWSPGKIDGHPVSVGRTITISFVIDDGEKKPAAKDTPTADVVVTKYR
ncbi:TonB family protein [Pontibacter toksunensis]|uniref:TonB family protein n=1 Tax=Pontibacter toksunensis TaxID=1332631 RepID=A0ABW6BVH7_9BACT